MKVLPYILPIAMIGLGVFILLQYFSSGENRDLAFGIGGIVLGILFYIRRRNLMNKMNK